MAYQSEIELRVRVLDKELDELEARIKRIQNPFDISGARRGPSEAQRRAAAVRAQREEADLIRRSIEDLDRLRERKAEKRLQTNLRRVRFLRDQRIKAETAVERAAAERRQQRQNAISSGLIGGAFPLLFGQGAGAAIGGGLGGAGGGFLGGQFGFGLSLVGTALGTAVDTFVQKIGDLANSLNDPAESLKALEEAGIKVNESVKDQVTSLLEAGRAYDAQTVVLEQINDALGPQAVEQLVAYKSETDRLNEKVQEISTSIQAEMLPALIGFLRVINGITAVVASEQFRQGLDRFFKASPLGIGGAITGESLKFLGLGGVTPGARPTLSLEQQRAEEQGVARSKSARISLGIEKQLTTIAGKRNELLDASVYKTREQLIYDRQRKAVQDLIARGAFTKANLDALEAKRVRELAELQAARNKQQETADKRAQTAADRAAKAAERLSKREKERLERSQKTGAALIRQLERDVALKEASTPLERELLNIAYAKETTQTRINELLDEVQRTRANELVQEREKLAVLEAQVNASLRLAGLRGADLEKTSFFTGDPSRAPGFEAGIGSDLFGREEEALNKFLEKYKEVGQAAQITSALVTTGFADMVSGTKSAEQVFADFLNSLADMLIKTAQQMIAQYIAIGIARMFAVGGSPSSAVSGVDMNQNFFKFIPQPGAGGFPIPRANGGPVSGGSPYMVGERGPELFVPSNSGTVVPNNALGGNVSIVVNVTEGQTDARGGDGQANQLGKSIAAAVQSELIKQKRPGGLLAR